MSKYLKHIEENRYYTIFEYVFQLEIIVSKSIEGNDMICELYKDKHAILCYVENDDKQDYPYIVLSLPIMNFDSFNPKPAICDAIKYIRDKIYKLNKDQDMICCWLKSVKKQDSNCRYKTSLKSWCDTLLSSVND